MRTIHRFAVVAAALAALVAGPELGAAQNYPNKPVTITSPAAAGNSPDVITRIAAERLSRLWGQQVVVLNRPGAGGLIALQAAAAPSVEKDGYTLYMTQASTYSVLPIQYEGRMPVNLETAFTAIGMLGEQPIAVAVNKDLPVKNVAELIEFANKTPGGIFFGGTTRGGQSHLTGELFREKSKAKIDFVHSAGAAVTLNDVIAGRIPVTFDALAGLAPGIQGGGVRVLGVGSSKRLPNYPDIPTIAETVPGVVSSGWSVLMAPAGVPDGIIRKVNADLRKVVAMPEVIELFNKAGTYSRDLTPEQTNEFLRSEEKLWWPIVRQLNQSAK